VLSVVAHSPADRAGLRAGDEIIALDGVAMTSRRDVLTAIAPHQLGDVVAVRVRRAGATLDATVTLVELAPTDRGHTDALVGKPAPDFTLAKLDGDPVKLADFAKRPVVLVFWSVHCEMCGAMLEILARHATDTAVVAIAPDARVDIQPFVAGRELPFTFAVDPDGAVAKRYGLSTPPFIVLVDRAGVVRRGERILDLDAFDADLAEARK
jgi:peroxiredoxin